ncbi:MAG: NAD(P)/FAD-dependent oxidoreductase [Sulfolobaceae archaeon]|nr:NAD(P)/FAD-dependent oxidoreductase [Sulfolobales archaeon]
MVPHLEPMPRAVVIGSGHNGLIAARELKEAGLDVIVLEARKKIGGLTETAELCNAKVSRVSYVLGLMPKALVDKYKIPLVRIDPFQVFLVSGKAIPFFVNPEYRRKVLRSLGYECLAEFDEKLMKVRDVLYSKFLFVERPRSLSELREELERSGLEEFATESASEVLKRYVPEEFRRFYVYPSSLSAPAVIIAYYYSPNWSLVKGGNGTIADVLAEGLRVETEAEVIEVVEKGGRVVRVVTRDGRAFEADYFVFAGSPVALWRLLGKRVSPLGTPGWRKVNAVLEEPPKIEGLERFMQSIIDSEYGEALFPGLADPTRGGITLEMMGDFEDFVKDLRLKVRCYEEVTPEEVERDYFLPYAQVNHLPMTREYLFENRPGYHTEFENLFLASAGAYPGGQILGVQGYNVANIIKKKVTSSS